MISSAWKLGLAAVLGTILIASSPLSADESKLDRLILKNGQSFVGHVVEETDSSVTMEVIVGGIKAKRTWSRSDVYELELDAVEAEPDAAADTPADDPAAELPDDGRPVVYVLPIRGLIGYDAHKDIIQRLWQEALDANAKAVILDFECHDGFYDLDEYRDFFEDIKREAKQKEIDLAVWISEARGVAVAYAMMFEQIYFRPTGWMGDGESFDKLLKDMYSDEDVQAKMISAWVSTCRGMAEEGGYSDLLCEAMIRPEVVLSLEWEGEDAIFYQDTAHRWTVDGSTEEALQLWADDARRYAVAKGVARTLDDLMFQLGYREYYHHEGKAEDLTEYWIEGWQNAWDDYQLIRMDMQEIDGSNDEPERKISRKMGKLKEIERLVRRWPVLSKAPYNVTPERLQLEMDELVRQMRALRERNDG